MYKFADIVLPITQQKLYTYAVVEGNETLGVGDAVAVELGAKNQGNNIYTGIVWRLHNNPPSVKRVRPIIKRLYPFALLSQRQITFWEWMASYYMCTIGDVMRMALPSLIKPSAKSETEFSDVEYAPRKELYIELTTNSEELPSRARRLHEVLEQIRTLSNHLGKVPRRLIECEMTHLHALVKRGQITFEERAFYLEELQNESFSLPILSPIQEQVREQITTCWETKNTTLLHGITGSGKTEIYLHLITECIKKGGDALLLLPEIALSTQLMERVEQVFGARVICYHSKLSTRKRSENYMRLLSSQGGSVVVGVRSAIFLPLNKLQLIIVDEEHDSSYKQSDPAPRYNARDAAVMTASIFGAKTLLGSATPSLESWTNSQSGKYGFVELMERYGDSIPPTITISDTLRSAKRGERKGHFNKELLDAIKKRMQIGEQTILFQNRRGFSPYIECKNCGWSARCPHCNVSLTLHKNSHRLICHYCNYSIEYPSLCQECQQPTLEMMGFGTEKIEEQLGEILDNAHVGRLDRDSVSSKGAMQSIVDEFKQGKTNILVGTQMISKGFDFERVTLVGALNADNLLNSPDFRAEERAFQLLTQVAGRAGRRKQQGEVIIQSAQPNHRVLRYVRDADYNSMARSLLAERRLFFYPPYSRIIQITLRHSDQSRLYSGANALCAQLRHIFGRRVQGPTPPPVDRIASEWIVIFTIKIEIGASSKGAKEQLAKALDSWLLEHKNIKFTVDVDTQ